MSSLKEVANEPVLGHKAIVKSYHDKEGSVELLNFLSENSTDPVLTTSDFAPIEFRSTLLKRVSSDEFSDRLP